MKQKTLDTIVNAILEDRPAYNEAMERVLYIIARHKQLQGRGEVGIEPMLLASLSRDCERIAKAYHPYRGEE
jgi:hypothetical protein